MVTRNRLARLERLMEKHGWNGCHMCRARLAGKVPVKETLLAAGEPVPPADHCPACGAEWPMLIMETPGYGPFMVLSPLPYDPMSARKADQA